MKIWPNTLKVRLDIQDIKNMLIGINGSITANQTKIIQYLESERLGHLSVYTGFFVWNDDKLDIMNSFELWNLYRFLKNNWI